MSRPVSKRTTLPSEAPSRVPALEPGQPSRADGERVVAQWKDATLATATKRQLRGIIAVLSGLRRHDVGLWEQKLLDDARAELRHRSEGVP